MTAVDSPALAPALLTPRLPADGAAAWGAADALPTTPDRASRTRRRILRALLGAGLLLAFAGMCAVEGLPTDRVVLLGWVLAGLVLFALLDGVRRVGRLLADWLPLAAVLMAYDVSRGLADGLGATVHVTEPAAADRWMTGGELPTVVLQQHWHADWWMALAALVYGSHFIATPLVLGVLWLRDRARWARTARLVIGLSAAGLVTYVLYPAAPPWLAAREGVIEPVRRLSGAGWEVLGLPRAGTLLADSQQQVNQVAAVPSLHTGFAVLLCLALFPVARRAWQRAALAAYPPLMALVLVWAGEHYVIDTVLGAVYAVGIVLLMRRVEPALASLGRRVRAMRPAAVIPAAAAPTVEA